MKIAQNLYFDVFYRLKKIRLQKILKLKDFPLFSIFSIVKYLTGHIIVKKGPIFMKIAQKLYFDVFYRLKKSDLKKRLNCTIY